MWQGAAAIGGLFFVLGAATEGLTVQLVAGLWDEWRDRQAGETNRSCAMIITDATEFVGELHDRMPVILEPKQFQASLTGGAGLELLKPAANDLLQ